MKKIHLVVSLLIVWGVGAACGDEGDGNEDVSDDNSVETDTDTTRDSESETVEPVRDIAITQSSKISTVAIVEWRNGLGDIDVEDIDDAYIEFGLGDDFTYTAPVNVSEKNMRTVLLGMKANAMSYAVRSTIVANGETYQSPVHTFETGFAPITVPAPSEEYRHNSIEIDEGFILTGTFSGEAWGIVIDTDGDVVWWTKGKKSTGTSSAGTSEMVMDWSGKYFYLIATNPSQVESEIRRISLDGEEVKDYEAGAAHHSLAPVPEGGVAFVQAQEDTCDAIMHLDEDGKITKLFGWTDVVDFSTSCHTNYVGYEHDFDSFYLSSRNYDIAACVSREGVLHWALGRDEYETAKSQDFDIGNTHDVVALHGLYVWNKGRNLLLFNNAEGDTSRIYEYDIAADFKTAEIVWEYSRDGIGSLELGGVTRLPSGNTQIVYSIAGIINQLDANGTVIQKIDVHEAIGYGNWRPSLYGPPPE